MLPQKQEPMYYHNFDKFVDVVSVLFNNADTCSVHKASLTWINVCVEHWWNDSDREKPKHLEEHLSQYHFVRNPTSTNLWLTRILRWEDGN